MSAPRLRVVGVRSAFACLIAFAAAARATAAPATVDFSRDVQPILSDNCYFCHGPDAEKRKGHLRLDLKDPRIGPYADHDGDTPVVPGNPAKSELMRRVTTDDPEDKMPPAKSNRRLSSAQVATLRHWIEQGAPWEKHWSLVPPKRSPLPDVPNPAWRRNPIDRFVLARLQQERLSPSPQADRATLLRRVSLDLTGIPPTPAELADFLADARPNAYERVVDRLLASPRFGERMVWEWLDAARYADTNGYQGDGTRTMWPWRDWVIRAMNDNMPYDRFTIEQLAGDLLPGATMDDELATGFCRNYMINGEGGRIPEENRVDYVMDQSETVGAVWLGLTVGCARCHDHKFDPITQKDYYSLFAFFNNTPVTGAGGDGHTPPVIDFTTPDQKRKQGELQASVERSAGEVGEMEGRLFPRDPGKRLTDSPRAKQLDLSGNLVALLGRPPIKRDNDGLREAVNFFRHREPDYSAALGRLRAAVVARNEFDQNVPRVMVMQESHPRQAFVLTKGAYDKPTDKVSADTPSCLPALPAGVKHDRLALARWLVSADNPLTARVTVNRYWQQFFGYGLVKTMQDFGVQGEPPVNPALLDWLAREFQDGSAGDTDPADPDTPRHGPWDVKAIDRLIVTSMAYRQSSNVTPALFDRDPENRLLARGPRYRLPSWMLRDQALAASGLLVEQVGGAPVYPYQPPGIWEEATFGQIGYRQDHGPSLYRRSVYTFWRRIVGPTEFFDVAARQTCTITQTRTNTPLHALTTLNDTTYVESARALAQRVMQASAGDDARLDDVYRRVLCRTPTDAERAVLHSALDRLRAQYTDDAGAAQSLLSVGESKRDAKLNPADHAAWTALCLEIFNTDEALSKE